MENNYINYRNKVLVNGNGRTVTEGQKVPNYETL